MTDPTRLIDEAGGDELEGSLLRLARSEAPSADGRRKIMAGIAAAGVTTLAAQGAQATLAASKGMSVIKWGVVAAVAVAIPAAILLRSTDEPTPAKLMPSALKAPATEVKAKPLQPSDAEGPAPLALEDLPTLPTDLPATGGPAKQQGSLADEVAQLQKAKLALKGGSPAQALAELGTYAQRFPRPMLRAEATVLRIEALSQSGDVAHAKTLAEGFLAKNPNSPYAARLRSLTGAR
jgi:hypothetical protein